MNAIQLIAAERKRQISIELWDSDHDDNHWDNELAIAAAVYALPREKRRLSILGDKLFEILWPWDLTWFKPVKGDQGRIRELVKAGALIAAEIDRLQRL